MLWPVLLLLYWLGSFAARARAGAERELVIRAGPGLLLLEQRIPPLAENCVVVPPLLLLLMTMPGPFVCAMERAREDREGPSGGH